MIIGIDGSRAFVDQKTGTERYSWEMLRALAEADKENEYRIYVKNVSKIKKEILRIHSKSSVESFVNCKLKIGNFIYIEISWPRFWTQGGLAWRTWVDKLDVLWVPAHTLPVLGNPRLPMVVTIHGIEYEYLPGAYSRGMNWHLTWSTMWAIKRAQKIIAVSNKTKEDLINKLGANKDKIEVIWEGVGLSLRGTKPAYAGRQSGRFKKILEEYNLKSPYVLFVGTVQPRKNLVRLIEAFGKLVSSFGFQVSSSGNKKVGSQLATRNLQLIIVGKLGWDFDEILSAPKKFGIEGRVKFLGYVSDEDLTNLFTEASLYAEPSLQEGFGLPMLEAMAAGVPVIAANAGALPEVVGNAGILVNPESVESIAKGLSKGLGFQDIKNQKSNTDFSSQLVTGNLKLPSGCENLSGENLRKELIRRGYERVKKFSWDAEARELIKVFGGISAK